MKAPSGKVEPFLAGLSIGLLIGVMVFDFILPTGAVKGVVYVCLVMLSLASGKRSLPFLAAAAFTALIAYNLLLKYPNPLEISWTILGANSLVVLALWMTASVSLAVKRVEEYVEDLKTLLHLCPSCKKIRDEKGMWHKIEDYLKAQTSRETASGFCPGCRNKWHAGHGWQS